MDVNAGFSRKRHAALLARGEGGGRRWLDGVVAEESRAGESGGEGNASGGPERGRSSVVGGLLAVLADGGVWLVSFSPHWNLPCRWMPCPASCHAGPANLAVPLAHLPTYTLITGPSGTFEGSSLSIGSRPKRHPNKTHWVFSSPRLIGADEHADRPDCRPQTTNRPAVHQGLEHPCE